MHAEFFKPFLCMELHVVRAFFPPHMPPRPGGVDARRRPLGGKSEGSIPVVLGFFFVVFDSHRGKRESVSKRRSQLSLAVVS